MKRFFLENVNVTEPRAAFVLSAGEEVAITNALESFLSKERTRSVDERIARKFLALLKADVNEKKNGVHTIEAARLIIIKDLTGGI